MHQDYDRPFLPIEKQVSHLRKKNIIIHNEPFVIEALTTHSYYAIINGFKDIFGTHYDTEDKIEKFNIDTDFDFLYTLFTIDNDLNSIMFKYIIYVERSLKTKLAYEVGDKYGVSIDAYLTFTNYRDNGDLDRKKVIENIKGQISGNRLKSASVIHYTKNHNHIPPWIAVNELYFGTTINWYRILDSDLKDKIANDFFKYTLLKDIEDKKTLLLDMLTLLQTYRNNMAHGSRTFETNVPRELPKIELLACVPDYLVSEQEFLFGFGKKDIYAVMVSILVLLNDKFVLNTFIRDLETLITPFEAADIILSPKGDIFNTLQLPSDFLARFNKYVEDKFKEK